jgi:putative phage-type endonuclease
MPNITARDFPTILNINPYETAYQCLETKVEKKHMFFGNKFTEHGCKYEKLAIKTYEIQTGNKVSSNQGIAKHPEYKWITGRVDGLTEIIENNENIAVNSTKKRRKLNNKKGINILPCIVEVKCPLKKDRDTELTLENMPIYYWAQCQVYMNILDYEYTHYVEFYIEPNAPEDTGILYYITVPRDRLWWTESLPKIKLFYDEMKEYCDKGDLSSHPIRIVENLWKKQFVTEENNIVS